LAIAILHLVWADGSAGRLPHRRGSGGDAPHLPRPGTAKPPASTYADGVSRIFTTSFASAYPHYVTKVEKKGRTKAELGVRVEAIEDPLMQQIRYLDKLVDELAKGKAMEKVLRA
jgi:hypothetical protein